MPKQIVTDEDFIAAWNELGSATLVSRKLGLTERTVMHRRSLIESKLNISLHAHNDQRFNRHIIHSESKIRSIADVTGSVVVFSDAHFMPNETSTAFNALIKVIKKVRPQIVIANGDILDGGTISNMGRKAGKPSRRLSRNSNLCNGTWIKSSRPAKAWAPFCIGPLVTMI